MGSSNTERSRPSAEPTGSVLVEALKETHRHIEELERIQSQSDRTVYTWEAKARAEALTQRMLALSQNASGEWR